MASFTPRIDSHSRNLAVNGNFDFWQRGTSFASANSYTADRWLIGQSGYTAAVTRSTDVPTVAQSGYQGLYSLLLTNGTGAAAGTSLFQQIIYKVEGYDYQNLHARRGRIQIWLKSSVTGTFPVTLLNPSSTRSYVTTYTITAANTWQKITLDPSFDTTGTWLFDNGVGLLIIFSITIGTNFQTSTINTWTSSGSQGLTGQAQWGTTTGATFQMSQFMIIPEDLSNAPANVDIPFQRAGRTIGDELRLCQRYYEKSYATDVAPGTSGGTNRIMLTPAVYTSNAFQCPSIGFFVPKRATPSVVFYTSGGVSGNLTYQVPGGGGGGNIVTTAGVADVNRVEPNPTVSGLSTSSTYSVYGHFTADAEL